MVTQVLPAVIAVGGAIIGTLVKALTEVGKFIGDNAGLVLSLAAAYTAFTVAINLAAAAARAKVAVMALLNLSVASFGGPLVLAIALIAALVAGLVVAYNSSKEFRDIVDALFRAIQPLLKVVIDLALFIGTNIVRAFGLAVSVVSELAKVLWDDGKGPLAIALGAIGKLFEIITTPIRFFIGLVQDALNVVQKLINLANSLPIIGGFLPKPTPQSKSKPGRALGGPVTGGQQYMVGERGPELFVPNQSGSIVPNNGMGGQVNVTVQAGAFLGSSDDAREFARRIYGALNDEARRRGTVLGGSR
jgi:hypothetical protein